MKVSDGALAALSGVFDMAWKIGFSVSIAYYIGVPDYKSACFLFCFYLGMLKGTK